MLDDRGPRRRPTYCRVCGLDQGMLEPWARDEKTPSHGICPCCGVEWGNEDGTLESTRKYRDEWVQKGTPWADASEKPSTWSWEKQRKQISPEWL